MDEISWFWRSGNSYDKIDAHRCETSQANHMGILLQQRVQATASTLTHALPQSVSLFLPNFQAGVDRVGASPAPTHSFHQFTRIPQQPNLNRRGRPLTRTATAHRTSRNIPRERLAPVQARPPAAGGAWLLSGSTDKEVVDAGKKDPAMDGAIQELDNLDPHKGNVMRGAFATTYDSSGSHDDENGDAYVIKESKPPCRGATDSQKAVTCFFTL